MEKTYQPKDFEQRLYSWWESSGFFKAQDTSDRPAFSMVIPPPNVTGALHNGHALFLTIQDILIRWKRMSGFNTVWIPGTDHAGIATQMVVEKELKKEGLNRHDLGREKFLERVWLWKEKHGSLITQQMRAMGASLDWDRSRFTMDQDLSKAVREAFVRLYEEGLIYRGASIINWCFRCQTALSDLEVVAQERKSSFWYIHYKVTDPEQIQKWGIESLLVATTRPETVLADTAVAVNPHDPRFLKLRESGETLKVRVPLTDRLVPVIFDDHVDLEFGTGCLKVTPGHDFNDYDLGQRHQLPILSLLDREGRIQIAPYEGLKIQESRDAIVADLQAQGLLEKIDPHNQSVGVCDRCETVVEPIVSHQWFVKAATLAQPALQAVRKGESISLNALDSQDQALKIFPSLWNATYYHWMENIRDWCISRQLWWGHQIPAWHCSDCRKISVSRTDLSSCPHCKNSDPKNFYRDPDVLDTWFSSSLWPFSTLGWPEKTQAYDTFYPTSVLETGFDILFFWVARMIMMGMHFNEGKVPFTRVYLHNLIRDDKGQKMSKTKGNVIDPLVVINQYGTDAFRFTLAHLSGQNRDIKLSLQNVETYGAFCNKIWNAARYVFLRMGIIPDDSGAHLQVLSRESTLQLLQSASEESGSLELWIQDHFETLHPLHRWILTHFQQALEKVHKGLEEFRFQESTQALWHFLWSQFCDWYIEFSKELLQQPKQQSETALVLLYLLRESLKMAHPFMPFISEEIYQTLTEALCSSSKEDSTNKPTLMLESFPKPNAKLSDSTTQTKVDLWIEIIERLRTFRGENRLSPKQKFVVHLESSGSYLQTVKEGQSLLERLAHLETLHLHENAQNISVDTMAEVPWSQGNLYIPYAGLLDLKEERLRLEKELKKLQEDLDFVTTKLSKESFVSRAPQAVIDDLKDKLSSYTIQKERSQKAYDKLIKFN